MIFDKISPFSKVSFHFYMLIIIYLANYYYFVLPKSLIILVINGFIFGTYFFYILNSTLKLVSETERHKQELINKDALLKLEQENHRLTRKNAIKTIEEIKGVKK